MSADGFGVDVQGGPSPVVRVTGAIDLETSGRLGEAVAGALAERSASTVVFDLADVDFIDSSGLAVLVNVAGAGHRVVVRNPSVVVRRVIETTGLEDVLRFET